MSNLYGASQITSLEEMANDDALLELFLIDDLMNGSADDIKNFCESAEGSVIMEKTGLDKKIVDRATVRKMDLNRRIKLTAYYMAKQANSPDFAKLVKAQKMKKMYAGKILQKYGKKAERLAKLAQKEFIKKSRGASANKESK